MLPECTSIPAIICGLAISKEDEFDEFRDGIATKDTCRACLTLFKRTLARTMRCNDEGAGSKKKSKCAECHDEVIRVERLIEVIGLLDLDVIRERC
jgi:hypothetical protein